MRTTHLVLGGMATALGLAWMAGCGGDDTSADPSSASTSSATSSSTSSASSSGATGTGGTGATGGGGSSAGGAGSGGGPMGDWTCLGMVVWPAPVKATITLDLTLVSFTSMDGIPDLTVKACAKADTTCTVALSTATTDAMGSAQLTVPTGVDGFDGYFDIKGTDIPDSIVFAYPYVGDDTSLSAPILDSSTLDTFAAISGVTVDATRGLVAGFVSDCTFSAPAPGVSVKASTADASSKQVYVANMLPSAAATETDSTGVTGIFNVPAGPLTLTATRVATSEKTSTVAAVVRPKTVTYVSIPPSP